MVATSSNMGCMCQDKVIAEGVVVIKDVSILCEFRYADESLRPKGIYLW